MSNFFPISVKAIDRLTDDSVCIKFNLSSVDANLFNFRSGQYITIEQEIDSSNVRRSYSISSLPEAGIEIGVKLVPNGLMSTFLNSKLKEGDVLNVMPPAGEFFLEIDKTNNKHYVGICSGSGITPVLSMIKNVLKNEPLSRFTLIYGNKSFSSVMYSDEINSFKNDFNDRFLIFNAYSQEKIDGTINGRIDEYSLKALFDNNPDLMNSDSYFICGPGNMIENVKKFLDLNSIENNKINFELFSSPDSAKHENNRAENIEVNSNVTVCIDGDDFNFELSSNGPAILDAAIEAGADVPFSCKGGVCSVCKAKIIKGTASMDMNYSLSEDDVEEGFVLTCQAHPTSEDIYVDYDEM